VTSDGIMSIPNFAKIGHIIKLSKGAHTDSMVISQNYFSP